LSYAPHLKRCSATARSVVPSLRTTSVEIDGKHGATRFPEKTSKK
jgi:hypothetical protein